MARINQIASRARMKYTMGAPGAVMWSGMTYPVVRGTKHVRGDLR